jgi:exodeoxyribonuclease VII small subunit
VPTNPASSYAAALSELNEIRDRLATGELPVDDIGDLVQRAALAAAEARAALRRAGERIELLAGVVDRTVS